MNLSLQTLSQNGGLLTNRVQLNADGVTTARIAKPVRCVVPILGADTQAEIIARSKGGCFFFRTHLGTLPFTAQGPAARQLVLDILKALRGNTQMLSGDVDIVLSGKGDVHLRGSLLTETQPTLETFLTALALYAQQAKPFLLELKPLLH